jgi:hypothetical protein
MKHIHFSNAFFSGDEDASGGSISEPRGKRSSLLYLATMIGFANGVQLSVKNRFDTYFGALNRVDVIGNHAFVTVNTVSLSAMDQADPLTGSSGSGGGTATTMPNMQI